MGRTMSIELLRTRMLALCIAMPTLLLACRGKQEAVPKPQPEPVIAAFGIPLGGPFDTDMVKRVSSRENKAYRGRDDTELTGTLYHVDPTAPDEHFSVYTVATTKDGLVYSIRAEYEAPDGTSRCEVTKKLAVSLEQKHGKPRGKGSFGEWYAFRDMSVEHYRGIRLYSNRCQRGIYEIVYSDDGARLAPTSQTADANESGL